ncbi:MAG TPA: hypothetical protein VHZ07_09725 [Bryobacteraceae bacterium]|jgi:hypothetical protein|nr:hypothetical protein [Bryobacteraceae bacterium]
MDIRRQLILFFFFVLICVRPMQSAGTWIKVTTPNFEMYTTNDQKDAARALQVFEQIRYFFVASSPSKPVSSSPVRIVAFRSEREYAPYRLNAGAFAYYVRCHNRDYIVMQDIEPAHYPAAMHEYTHLIVEHLNLHFPVWLNEGLAEFYSSLEARGNQAVVGGVLPGRMAILKSRPWLDLKLLFSVDQSSSYYNERDKMSVFYAESWALTHMLELGDTYRGRFPEFLLAAASGKAVEDCFRSIYGKDLVAVAADLRTYANPSTLRAGIVDVKLPRSAFDTKTAPLPPLETELALTDLLASRKQTWGEASKRLRKLADDHPDNLAVEESIAYLEWQRNQTSAARDHIARAIQLGSTDPDVLYLYAQLLHQTNAPETEVLSVLERVVAARPDFADAQLNLALTAMNMQNWGRAATALSSMKTIRPDRAFAVFSAIATCDLSLGHVEAARQAAQQAQQYAKTTEQKGEAQKLIAQFQSIQVSPPAAEPEPPEVAPEPVAPPTPPVPQQPVSSKHEASRDEPMIHWAGDVQHVEATAQTFECHGKELRLHVQVNSRAMVFQIDNPNEVLIRNAGSKSVELTCGPQKPFHLGIFYIPTPDSGAIAGKVKELVF